jgi:hypothetical protein
MFVDGTQIGVTHNIGTDTIRDSALSLKIGVRNDNGTPFNGWLDEIRISNGIARWTSTFTPPTEAYGEARPVNTVAPTVTGTATGGQTLYSTTGSWTNSPTSYSYQWQRDNQGGGVYANILGATGGSYLLLTADRACNVRCMVTATNEFGSLSANSNAAGPVAAEPGDPLGLRARFARTHRRARWYR